MPKPSTTPRTDRLYRRLLDLQQQWRDIQNAANLREARRLQRQGRYTKAERADLDRLLTEMEAVTRQRQQTGGQ